MRDRIGAGSDEAVIAHLRRYAEPALARVPAVAERITGHAYDWAINAPADGGKLLRSSPGMLQRRNFGMRRTA